MDDEDVSVGFLVLPDQVVPGGVIPEAARFDAEHVDGGFALDDPFGQLPARAARGRNAETVPFGQPEVFEVPGRADDRVAVGRIGDGAVVNRLDSHLGECRHPRHGGLDVGHQAVDVFLEQFVLGRRIRAVNVAARRVLLVGTEDKAAVFLAQVPGSVRFAQYAEFRQALAFALFQRGMGLGDDVLVFNGHYGDVEPNHFPGLAGVVAGRRHHVIAGDVSLVCMHDPAAGGRPGDAHDSGLPVNFRAAGAGADGKGLGQIGRLNIAVLGMIDSAHETVDIA